MKNNTLHATMRKKELALGSLIAVLAIAGFCLAIKQRLVAEMLEISQQFKPMLVINDGYQVQIGAELARVYGSDIYRCGAETHCKGIIVEEGSKEVTLLLSGVIISEQWMITKDAMIKRPNGEYVLRRID